MIYQEIARKFALNERMTKLFMEHPSTELMLQESPKEVAALLAQCAVETGDLTPKRESLNYGATALYTKFPRYFTQTVAYQVGRTDTQPAQQSEIARIMYGGRMGNDTQGDGWLYRGRGFIQTTGEDNYRALGKLMEINLIKDPDALLNPTVAVSAAWLMYLRMGLQKAFLDRGIIGLSRAVNLGNPASRMKSLHEADRVYLYEQLCPIMEGSHDL